MKKGKSIDFISEEGMIFIEQELTRGYRKGQIGVNVAPNGKVWICLDGIAVIRFAPGTPEFMKDEKNNQ